jgi:hypothetical protein
LGGFSSELQQLAAGPGQRLFLVTDTDMLNRGQRGLQWFQNCGMPKALLSKGD